MTCDNTSARAAAALDALFAGPHKHKRVQAVFDCSARMAAYLLAGNHWTAKRLSQAREALGDAWDAAFAAPPTAWRSNFESQDFYRRLDRVEQQLVEMARLVKGQMAPQQSQTQTLGQREFGEGHAPLSKSGSNKTNTKSR